LLHQRKHWSFLNSNHFCRHSVNSEPLSKMVLVISVLARTHTGHPVITHDFHRIPISDDPAHTLD
jgi:hypothetical protein